MQFINNLKVRTRVLAVAILPMLGLVGFGGFVLVEENAAMTEAAEIRVLVDVTPTISELIHQLQIERGRAAGFLGSDGDQAYRTALQEHFANTDVALAVYRKDIADALTNATDAGLVRHTEIVSGRLDELTMVREAVLSGETDVPTMAAYYGGTIANLVAEIRDISKLSANGPLTEALVAYVAFLQGKEYAGQERAMGASGFASGRFAPAAYQRFVTLIGMQSDQFTLFVHRAEPALVAAFEAVTTGEASQVVKGMREVGLAGGFGGDMSSVSGLAWFESATRRIDALKRLEDQIGAALRQRVASLQASSETTAMISLVVVIGLVLATTAVIYFGVRSITRPVGSLTRTMRTLADGDNTVAVPATTQRDEIGDMARAVEVFKQNAIEMEAMRAEQAAQEERARVEAKKARDAMADSFEVSVGGVVTALTAAASQMQGSATSMSSTAQQTSEQAGAVAAASEEASASVQTVASATEQMAASVSEIASQVGKSHTIANNAVSQAKATNGQVRGLVDAVQKIGEVVELISAIAEQTNLLALNATIEAARAGDAGKGFAVVASEVKSLATQTAKATGQISEQINGIQAATTDAATAIEAIGSIIEEMSGISSSVAAAVEEQDAATSEITRSIREAATGTEQVATNISGVGEAAGQTGHAASEVLEAANGLSTEADRLRDEVATFLAQVRAA